MDFENDFGIDDNRFGSTSIDQLNEHVEAAVPQNTSLKEKWAIKLFKDWHAIWKIRMDDKILKVFKDIEEMNSSDLNHTLKYFIADVRKKDGSKFPPRTLKEITAMIQHFCNYKLNRNWSFFNDAEFRDFIKVLDAEMKLSAKEGNVRPAKRAEVISFESEEELWNVGSLGSSNPRQLINTLIYLLGTHCAMRAASEHRNLMYGAQSQLKLTSIDGDEVLQYTESVSKCKNFGIKQSRMEPKQTIIHKNPLREDRCPVRLYKKYVQLRSQNICEAFYLTPLVNSEKSWFKNQPLGIHQIQKVISSLMKTISKDGYYTNTSTRRTAKTRLTVSGIPREISKRKTGHISNIDEVYIERNAMDREMSMAIYGQPQGQQTSAPCLGSGESSPEKETRMANSAHSNEEVGEDKIVVFLTNGNKHVKILI